MLVPKQHRHDVYKYLFKEGVMVAKKDFNKKKHDDPELNVPNLHVIKLMQSLKSRGFVNERFSWSWYYYYLTKRASTTSRSSSTSQLTLCQQPSRSRTGLHPGHPRAERVERVDTAVTMGTAVVVSAIRLALVVTSGLHTAVAVEVASKQTSD